MNASKQFEPFFDEVDFSLCCSSGVTHRELEKIVGSKACYFPLFADSDAPLDQQVAALEYTSRSARYGGYVDNILGMNWRLPCGGVVRIGERVVKNSTGYDLMRFLLHAPNRFGRATDYVLRLRARQTQFECVTFSGRMEGVETLWRDLLRSPWRHVVDAIDMIFAPGSGEPVLRISYDTTAAAAEEYLSYFKTIARTHAVTLDTDSDTVLMPLSSVAAAFKSTMGGAFALAGEIARSGWPVLCHSVNGYVVVGHDTEGNGPEPGQLELWRDRVVPHGGHLRIPGKTFYSQVETSWIEQLLEDWATEGDVLE